jgi:cell division protein FtsN
MVQIGAFSTLEAADAVVQQATKAGHTAAVTSNRTLHKVLIQAGPTRDDALKLAQKLGQAGFPGAFVVPPRP